jgi:hypothetical protein
MDKFNKNELELFKTGTRYRVVFLHKPSGLLIACDNNPYVTNKDEWVVQPPETTLAVIKHVWVDAWRGGEDSKYQVERLEDLPRLLEIVDSTRVQAVRLSASEEFMREALVKV